MKKKILFINSVCGFGSTGRIVADLSKISDYETLVCYGRKSDLANVNSFKFANFFDNALGAIQTILFDNNLNICTNATKRLIKKIKEFNPDIIHLHNVHGYYINVEMLFSFLKEYNKPVVWTLHDCWSLTGYCPHFEYMQCEQYKKICQNCPYGFAYPFSLFKQNVKNDFLKKKELFNSIDKLNIVTPSKWLSDIIDVSYLKNKNHLVINNGIKLENFNGDKSKNDKFTVLAVSSVWTKQKGIDELNKIIPLLDNNIDVVVVGANSNKVNAQKCIERTENRDELVNLYSSSHLLINPTLEDNFPTVNIEALACGIPIVTYKTGGSPEVVNKKTGVVIEKGNYQEMVDCINNLYKDYYFKKEDCIKEAQKYDYSIMLNRYKELYESLLVD